MRSQQLCLSRRHTAEALIPGKMSHFRPVEEKVRRQLIGSGQLHSTTETQNPERPKP